MTKEQLKSKIAEFEAILNDKDTHQDDISVFREAKAKAEVKLQSLESDVKAIEKKVEKTAKKVTSKVKVITAEEWEKTPKDYKSSIEGQKHILQMGKDGATELAPVNVKKATKKAKPVVKEDYLAVSDIKKGDTISFKRASNVKREQGIVKETEQFGKYVEKTVGGKKGARFRLALLVDMLMVKKAPAKKKAVAKKPAYKNVNQGHYSKLASKISKAEGITYKAAQKKASAIFKKEKEAKSSKSQPKSLFILSKTKFSPP